MVADAVVAGVELVETWIGCAVGVVRRLGVPLLAPVLGGRTPQLEAGPALAIDDPAEQTAVEETKYWVGSPAPRRLEPAVDRETRELPRAYGRDHIVLLPGDPWWAFAYWEVTPTSRVRALRALGDAAEGAREVLRVYDVTFITFTGDNAWLSFDVDLPPGADRWYLNLGRPAASFCVEIGLRTPGGWFLPLARSNVATTPRSSPSPDTTVRWVDVRGGALRETAVPWTGVRVPAAEDPLEEDRSRSSDIHTPPPR